jgi:hypothetical protein
MAEQVTVTKPAPFVEKIGTNLAENVLAQQGVPVITQGLGALQEAAQKANIPQTKQAFETQEQFDARKGIFDAQQRAALGFDQRQLALQGLAPQVAGQTKLQQDAQALATTAAGTSGIASFQPFLDKAQAQAGKAAELAGIAQTGLEGVGTTLGGINLGPMTGKQLATIDKDGNTVTPELAEGSYMSPYQSQVIDATLAAFDRNMKKQELQIKDQAAKLGVLGTGRAGVRLGEFDTGAATQRALLEAQLLQQGFGQAQAARQQDIANRFGLAGAQQNVAGAQQGLGAFRSGLGGQQAGLGAQTEGILGTNIGRLGSLGAINQAQAQAEEDARREATRMVAFQPQEQLDRYGAQVAGIMGGYPGQVATTNVPNPTPLQSALGIGTTLAGLYLGRR